MGSAVAGLVSSVVPAALGGLFSGQRSREAANEGAWQDLQGRGMAMESEAAADYGAQQQNRTDFGNQLAQGALGKGPSIAQAQLQAAQDRTLAQQVAAAKANRAVNPALAARQVGQLAAQAQQATAQNAAVARLQEQRQQQASYQNYLDQLQNYRRGGAGSAISAASGLSGLQKGDQERTDKLMGSISSGAGGLMGSMLGGGGGAAGGVGGGKGASLMPSFSTGGLVEDSMRGVAPAYSDGGMVDGEAEVTGDSPKNDKVLIKTSPDEMVIPRTVVSAGPKEISNFAEALLKHKQNAVKTEEPKSFGAVLAAKAHLTQQLQELERKYNKKGS